CANAVTQVMRECCHLAITITITITNYDYEHELPDRARASIHPLSMIPSGNRVKNKGMMAHPLGW
ncbi:MAG TPA: hypothetical protein PK176_16250, partial [Acidobacteriota bacterium]|nr:hypothetical protein [Acidobacteriota bacterium]HQM64865.1 hypothetical protein [Acidobacteriota bacterium]